MLSQIVGGVVVGLGVDLADLIGRIQGGVHVALGIFDNRVPAEIGDFDNLSRLGVEASHMVSTRFQGDGLITRACLPSGPRSPDVPGVEAPSRWISWLPAVYTWSLVTGS